MKGIMFTLFWFLIGGALYSQKYTISWGELERKGGDLISIVPGTSNDFFTLRWSGGNLLGSYRITRHMDLSLSNKGRVIMKADGHMASFEGIACVEDRLMVFLSNKKDGINSIFMQEYTKDLKPKGPSYELGNFELPKIRSRGFFEIIHSKQRNHYGVVWEIPGRKESKTVYGFRIFNKNSELISKGEYELPFEDGLSTIYAHHLSNTGDYFISLMEYHYTSERKITRNKDFKAFHVYHVTASELEDFSFDLKGNRVVAASMSSDDDHMLTITGVYGENNTTGISGVFYLRADFDRREILDEGFEKFGKDFITQDWSEKQKNRATRNAAKGNGPPQLYDYKMRQSEILEDGSIVASMEQYYVVTYTYARGYSRTTMTYYYNDIIAFKVGLDGRFEWVKKIDKEQVSTNDGGPYSSYARFIDNGKLCFIFNDHIKNYTESGDFRNQEIYEANFSKKKNVVALVEIDMETGESTRRIFFDRKEIGAIAVPKEFVIDFINHEMILYALYGNKERFGVLPMSN
jgi:hypothetical protein